MSRAFQFDRIYVQAAWTLAIVAFVSVSQISELREFVLAAFLPLLLNLFPGRQKDAFQVSRIWYPVSAILIIAHATFEFSDWPRSFSSDAVESVTIIYLFVSTCALLLVILMLLILWPTLGLAGFRAQLLLVDKGYRLKFTEFAFLYLRFKDRKLRTLPPMEELLLLPNIDSADYMELKSLLRSMK